MRDWNAVITVHTGHFVEACRILEPFGPVQKTDFFNILVMHAADPFQVLADLHDQLADAPAVSRCLSRFMPMEQLFNFQSVTDFELRSREAVLVLLPRLANARFHVRMHRRGFKGRLSSMEEERFLDEFLLQHLADAGTPGKMAFEDPDVIIDLETLGTQGGLSLLTREQLARFPLLHVD